jgi:hypothetical protein
MCAQLNPTQWDAYLLVFTEAFIRAHIAGGTDLSQIKMRMKNDPDAQGSTLLSADAALQLKRDFEAMERGEDAGKITSLGGPRYWYNLPLKLINFDLQGRQTVVAGEFEFHVHLVNEVRKIGHFHRQKSAKRAKDYD